jgi:hypothetical protein
MHLAPKSTFWMRHFATLEMREEIASLVQAFLRK